MKQVRPNTAVRGRAVVAVAAALAALLGRAPGAGAQDRPADACTAAPAAAPLPTVAVLDFSLVSLGRTTTDEQSLRAGLADVLLTELASNPCIRVVERRELQHLLAEQDLGASGRVDPATAARVGRLLGAQHVIAGALTLDPRNNARLDARSVNVETSRVEVAQSVTGQADDVLRLLSDLGGRLNRALRLPAPPSRTERPASGQASWRAAQLYSRALMAQERGDVEAAATWYREALAVSPQFDRARVQLASLTRTGGS
jgi:TolB-like protein